MLQFQFSPSESTFGYSALEEDILRFQSIFTAFWDRQVARAVVSATQAAAEGRVVLGIAVGGGGGSGLLMEGDVGIGIAADGGAADGGAGGSHHGGDDEGGLAVGGAMSTFTKGMAVTIVGIEAHEGQTAIVTGLAKGTLSPFRRDSASTKQQLFVRVDGTGQMIRIWSKNAAPLEAKGAVLSAIDADADGGGGGAAAAELGGGASAASSAQRDASPPTDPARPQTEAARQHAALLHLLEEVQLDPAYQRLWFDFRHITDELVFYGMRAQSSQLIAPHCNLFYKLLFRHEVFETFAGGRPAAGGGEGGTQPRQHRRLLPLGAEARAPLPPKLVLWVRAPPWRGRAARSSHSQPAPLTRSITRSPFLALAAEPAALACCLVAGQAALLLPHALPRRRGRHHAAPPPPPRADREAARRGRASPKGGRRSAGPHRKRRRRCRALIGGDAIADRRRAQALDAHAPRSRFVGESWSREMMSARAAHSLSLLIHKFIGVGSIHTRSCGRPPRVDEACNEGESASSLAPE